MCKRLTILCACFLLPSFGFSAIVVIDNLALGTQGFAATLSGPLATDFFGDPFDNREVAFRFTSGPSLVALSELAFVSNLAGSPSLNSIQATLSTGVAAPGGQDLIALGLVAPTSNSPATQLLTITPASPVPLAPNTTYWIHFTVPAGEAVYTINNANTPVIQPGWALDNTWYYSPGDVWTEIVSGPQARMRLSVIAIPEPKLSMLGIAVVGALVTRRRRHIKAIRQRHYC